MGETPAEISSYRRDTRVIRAVIISGWVMTMAMTFGLIGAAVALWYMRIEVPDELKQWAAMSLGFLFGTFPTMLRDYIAAARD